MNRKTLVTVAVAGALGLVAVTAPAVASAFGASDRESTSVVVPGGVVTDVVSTDEPLVDRSTAIRTAVPTPPVASAVPVPPPVAPVPAEEEPDEELEAYDAPAPVVPPISPQDDRPDAGDRDRDDRGRNGDGPTSVNPEPHHPSDRADSDGDRREEDRREDDRGHRDDDRRDHDHRHGDDDDRRDDDGWSR